MRFQFARLPVLLFSIFLILSVFLGNANAGGTEYVRELAHDIVKNLEKQIKADELMVSLDLIKTKKDGKVIPLSRMLRRELKKYLEGSVKVTLPSPRSKPNTCSPGLSGLKGARRSFTQKSSIQKTVKNWHSIRLSG